MLLWTFVHKWYLSGHVFTSLGYSGLVASRSNSASTYWALSDSTTGSAPLGIPTGGSVGEFQFLTSLLTLLVCVFVDSHHMECKVEFYFCTWFFLNDLYNFTHLPVLMATCFCQLFQFHSWTMWCVGNLGAGPATWLQELLLPFPPHHAAWSPVSDCDGRKLSIEYWEQEKEM